MNNKFSENLKKIRKDHNLSQEQLADELGVSRQAISKWESASAYPEMDKIIALCDKFDVNIDDLLHRDIKEVKGEEESKKNLNKTIEDFLKFITDTVNLFFNMTFKSKIKFLIEEGFIALILFIASSIIMHFTASLSYPLLSFFPMKVKDFFSNILNLIIVLFCLISSIAIMVHIFKIRYLDYYNKIKKEKVTEEKVEENVPFQKKEEKIIIRDPKHSDYRFLNGLLKIIVGIIKFFVLCFALFICSILVSLFIFFILSFLISKTGFFFLGMEITILSSAIILMIIILILLNFVFNRENNKKRMITWFMISLVMFGVGCGLVGTGVLEFEVLDNNETILKKDTIELEMNEDLLLYPEYDNEISYIEEDIPNVKVEYSFNKFCQLNPRTSNNQKSIHAWVSCKNPTKIAREWLKNINQKKIIPFNNNIEKITVYASSENIAKIKNNWQMYLEKRKEENHLQEFYEERIHELENQLENYERQIAENYE